MREPILLCRSSFVLSIFSLITLAVSYLMVPTPPAGILGDSTTAWRRMGVLPAILIAVGVGGAAVFAMDLHSKREHVLHISVMWAVMVGMAHQIGLGTPIGSDGWFFVELSLRFSEFGFEPYINGYLMRPGALFPLLMASSFPFVTISVAASFLGILVAYLTTHLILSHILGKSRELKSVLPFIAVAWAGLVTTIGDLFDYEAHSLAVLLLFFFWFRLSLHRHRLACMIVLAWLCFTHLFIPLILIMSLFIQWLRDDDASKRDMGLIGLLMWCVWALFAFETTSSALFSFLENRPSRGIFVVGVIGLTGGFLFLSHWLVPDVLKGDSSVEHVQSSTILLSIAAFIPIFLYKDFTLDTIGFSFTKRVFLYTFPVLVPSLIRTQELHLLFSSSFTPAGTRSLIVILLISLVSVSAAVIHHRWVGRDLYFQSATEGCWDMVAEHGLGDISVLGHGPLFLHSPQLVPPEPTAFVYQYVDPADTSVTRASAVRIILETSDIPDRIEREGLTEVLNYTEWQLLGEVTGVCRLWIHPDLPIPQTMNSRLISV